MLFNQKLAGDRETRRGVESGVVATGAATETGDGRMDELAEAVRRACLEAALRGHEDAGQRGLCAEGRWEAAVAAIREVDVGPVIAGARRPS